jgi:hypothetical protein
MASTVTRDRVRFTVIRMAEDGGLSWEVLSVPMSSLRLTVDTYPAHHQPQTSS